MGGPDDYTEFDSSSIVTTTTGGDTIKLGRRTFRKRDLFLGGIAVLALLAFVVMAIVLIVELSKSSDDCHDESASVSHQKGSLPMPPAPSTSCQQSQFCVTAPCLKAAAYALEIMNQTADPCDDFYTYSCGAYAQANPQTPLLNDVTPSNIILNENIEKLLYQLNFPVTRRSEFSYERKLKDFIYSCNNHFDKMDLGGTPFVDKVMKRTGNWYLLGEWNATQFDFHESLKSVHIDYWTTAFFNVYVNVDQVDWNKKVVELGQGGLGMPPEYFNPDPNFAQIHSLYQEYMTALATAIAQDAGVAIDNNVIQTFVADAYEIEDKLALIVLQSPSYFEPHKTEYRMSLKDLDEHTGNTMDFVDYMKTMFNQWHTLFTEDTTVVVLRDDYFRRLGELLTPYMSSDVGKRKVHNYLMWQLLNRYSADLSWNYVHAKRKLDHLLQGIKDSGSGSLQCFLMAENSMSDALSAVFIKDFVDIRNKKEGDDIVAAVKAVLMKELDSFPWMTEADKMTAKHKIDGSITKVGFADYLVDDAYMDGLYVEAEIVHDDYFQNVLNLNRLQKSRYNDLMGRPSARTQWTYHIFQPVISYYNPWHELIATSAALQSPLFSHLGPRYYNYGGVGSAIARAFIHAVDELGNVYQLDGSHFGNWWGNTTATKYEEVKQCAVDAQKNVVFGPFESDVLNLFTPDVSRFSGPYAHELLAEAAGMRLSLKAYMENKPETLPPGFPNVSHEQMFFLAYAQAHCQNTAEDIKFGQLMTRVYPSKNRVNLAVTQVPEFAQAFNCPTSSRHFPAKRCLLFP